MRAAIRLRLKEAQRRGGLWLLAIAFVATLGIALFGGETVDGRYGLATDIAATLGYAAAIFIGAFPLAIDRERKRSYLPSASPVTPWGWAFGNAVAAAVVAATLTFALYAAAAIGAAAGGGIETWAMTRVGAEGTYRLRTGLPQKIYVPENTTKVRLMARTFLLAEDTRGTAETAEIGVSGRGYAVHDARPITVPVRLQSKTASDGTTEHYFHIRNRSPEYAVGIDTGSLRALTSEEPFFPNAVAAAFPAALGTASLAALGAAAGAHLGPAVAALAMTLLLLLASLKGFVLDIIDYEGTLQRSQEEVVVHGDHTHGGGNALRDHPFRAQAKRAIKTMLQAVPAVGNLDRTGEVATGRWVGLGRTIPAALQLVIALAIGAALGGFGIYMRRTP
ncbi:MAG: hypothetical protein ACYTGZ_15765 [Planctomycetota bacterium]|jgi:hypothetical protein